MTRKWPLYALLALFVIPFGAAYVVLHHTQNPNSTTAEHGQLIQPAEKFTFESKLDIPMWHVVYISPTPCSDVCVAQKDKLAKLHTALGAQQNRVSLTTTQNQIHLSTYKAGNILIVDPNGFAIMRYEPEDNLGGLLKDLKRLLKYSHV